VNPKARREKEVGCGSCVALTNRPVERTSDVFQLHDETRDRNARHARLVLLTGSFDELAHVREMPVGGNVELAVLAQSLARVLPR
jgi:hypothetical protein